MRGRLSGLAAGTGLAMVLVAGTVAVGPVGASVPAVDAATTAISHAECEANRAVGPITYVSPFGFDVSGGIIDVFAAQKLGFFRQMCLTVTVDAAAQDGDELVSAGRAQVTNIGGAATLLEVVANGSNLVGVATLADTTDEAVVTPKSVTSLRGLEGQTLGYHTAVGVAVQAMMAKAGVDVTKVDLVSTTNYTPDQVVNGTVDGLQVYQSNEPLHAPFGGQVVQRVHAGRVRREGDVQRPGVQRHVPERAPAGRGRLDAGGPPRGRLLHRPRHPVRRHRARGGRGGPRVQPRSRWPTRNRCGRSRAI